MSHHRAPWPHPPLEIPSQERFSHVPHPPALYLMPLGMTPCGGPAPCQQGWPRHHWGLWGTHWRALGIPNGSARLGSQHRTAICPPPSLQPLLRPWPSGCWARGTGNFLVLCPCPPWRGDSASECFKQAKTQGHLAKGGTVQQGPAGSQVQVWVPRGHRTLSPLRGQLSCPKMPWGAHGAHVKVEEPVSTRMCLGGAGGKQSPPP